MSQRPSVLPVDFEKIPPSLKSIDRWVLWRNVQRTKPSGERVWAKMPMTCAGVAASSTDPSTWASYDEAADALVLGSFDGLGLVLADGLHGIDLDDCRDPESGELSELALEVLSRVDGYAEVSPSGTGIKIFTPTNLDGSRTKKELGVELYVAGRYFTVTGHAINGHAAPAAAPQDLSWFVQKVWAEQLRPAAGGAGGSADLSLLKSPLLDWDADRILAEIAPWLDLEMHYEDWIKVGAALHHQFEGADEGFELWDSIFSSSSKYGGPEYGWERWRSFSQHRMMGKGSVTLASLIKTANEAREREEKEDRAARFEALRQAIVAVTDPRDLQDKVAPDVAADASLSDIEREQLAATIQVRARDLGVKLPIAVVRGWVRPRRAAGAGAGGAPEWAAPWVYVTEGDRFFNRETKQEVTAAGFRAMFNRFMPVTPDGSREKADQWALEQWDMQVVSHKAYMPTAGATFEMFGRQWVNLYRPESVPEVPVVLGDAETGAIETVRQHLRVYLRDEREQELLMSWLAWNVQHPGSKIRWAPYVHGAPGDGKSFFCELVGVAMGGQNVRSLNGSTLESNFTDWAVGYALVAIEEMKQHGHNRYDIMNRLKPFITNSQVEIHPKGKASYTAPNVSNYIVFSNYLDGAPVDEDDRRYMFLSSQLSVQDAERLTREGYFQRLFSAIQEHPGAIRKWLLELPLHPEFDANGRAPDTEVKRTVVEMSKSSLDSMAEDLIENAGAEGVSHDVVSSAHLVRALSVNGEAPSTSRVHTLLTRLGFRFAFRKKWKREACRVWVRQGVSLTDEAAVARLNASLESQFDFLR